MRLDFLGVKHKLVSKLATREEFDRMKKDLKDVYDFKKKDLVLHVQNF